MAEMEYWSWPPRYDDTYRPEAGSRYWVPTRETMPAGDRERAIVERLQKLCRYAYDKAPLYKKKCDEAGLHPAQIPSLDDFGSKAPETTETELHKPPQRL